MKFLSLLMVFVFGATFLLGQKILLVDDSKDNFENTQTLSDALNSVNIEHDMFDAASELETPDLNGLLEYDVVIWHTSNDGVDLLFWEGQDQENETLKSYLSEGKILWLIGNDFLFDRHATGVTFGAGSFEYDFLGITSYDAQSYQDDGNIGMPKAVPSENNPIELLNELSWQFATLWNADAVTPTVNAIPIYEMSSSDEFPNYVFVGSNTAVLNQFLGSTVLTYFFDLSLAESNEMIAANMESVIGFFSQLLVSAESTYLPTKSISISPNPVFESINVTSNIEGEIKVSVFSSSGKLMQMKRINQNGLINVADLPKGTYYIQFSSAKQSETQSFIKI